MRYNIGAEHGGHHRGTSLPCLSMGVPPPLCYVAVILLLSSMENILSQLLESHWPVCSQATCSLLIGW